MQLRDRKRELAIAPLWRLGFRPFFLAGGLFALIAIALWLAALAGHLAVWQPVGGWLAWHRHEMPFGFGVAIIAGFLLTAVQNWTGRAGLSGRPLMLLAALWLAARLGWLLGAPLVMLVPLQAAFLPLLAFVIGRSLWQVRQRNNYPVVAVLLLLGSADALVLTGLALGDDGLQRQGVLAAMWLIAALMGLIGGRVIPFFTQRGLSLTQQVKALPFACLALGNAVRLGRWYDAGIWRVPLLWSLHLAFAWLVVAPFGQALWHLGLLGNPSLPLHALAVGAMGGLILAMLARVSLGHTGRPLSPPKAMGVAFALVNCGAVARVFLPGLLPNLALPLAGICWLAAFALFLAHYAPMFCRSRVDGQPG